ncbi:MAG: SipW-dependent-type signal peptide-containing protein [Oscillospiraceae bacterium]|nr:SipW-dependent-type signal peptide-containing protein [Oscillospiraceae bacterium]
MPKGRSSMDVSRRRNARKATLIRVGLALLMCLFLFAVAGYAWFTDVSWTEASFTSGSVKLEVKAYRTKDAESAVAGTGVYDGKGGYPIGNKTEGKLFDNAGWTAGSYDAKYILVQNTGSLTAKFEIYLELEETSLLAPFVELHVTKCSDLYQMPNRSEWKSKPMAEQLKGGRLFVASGSLLPGDGAYYRIDYFTKEFEELGGSLPEGASLKADFMVYAWQDPEPAVFVKGFGEFKDALDTDYATIVFLGDITVPSWAMASGVFTVEGSHNIDLNGFALKAPSGSLVFAYRGGGAVDIGNGSIWAKGVTFNLPGTAVNLADSLRLYTEDKPQYEAGTFHNNAKVLDYDKYTNAPSAWVSIGYKVDSGDDEGEGNIVTAITMENCAFLETFFPAYKFVRVADGAGDTASAVKLVATGLAESHLTGYPFGYNPAANHVVMKKADSSEVSLYFRANYKVLDVSNGAIRCAVEVFVTNGGSPDFGSAQPKMVLKFNLIPGGSGEVMVTASP